MNCCCEGVDYLIEHECVSRLLTCIFCPLVCSIYTIRNIPHFISSIGHSISSCTSWLCGATTDNVRNIPNAISSIRQPINRRISSLGNSANHGISNLARVLGDWGNAVSNHCSSLVRLTRFRGRNEPDISTSVEPDTEELSEITTSSSQESESSEGANQTEQGQPHFYGRLSFTNLMNPFSIFYRPERQDHIEQSGESLNNRRPSFASLMNPFYYVCRSECNSPGNVTTEQQIEQQRQEAESAMEEQSQIAQSETLSQHEGSGVSGYVWSILNYFNFFHATSAETDPEIGSADQSDSITSTNTM